MSGDGRLPGCRAAALAVLVATLACAVNGSSGQGTAAARPNARTPIHLSATVRAEFRRGMRVLLQRIQGIVEGLAQHNMGQVAKHAKRAGAEMLDDVPISDAIELPVEFAILAIETHDKFDELSRACEEGSSASGASKHLAAILAKCNGCHATYRLAPE